jgi:hypothetical protein
VSKAGQYVTVWVALKNTGASPRKFGMGGSRLRAGGALYSASGTSIVHPRLSDDIIELPPKDLTVVSLYFNVPADADPERLHTTFDFPPPSGIGPLRGGRPLSISPGRRSATCPRRGGWRCSWS